LEEVERFPRSDEAPTKAQVIGWPFPQYAQDNSDDIAKTEHINQDVYDYVTGALPNEREISRQRGAPTKADVIGWPFPQYAQNQNKDWNPLNAPNDVEDRFSRSESAPTRPLVINWPTRQEIYEPQVSGKAYVPPELGLAQKEEPSPDYGIDERFDRPDKAPTKSQVIGWPYPQFAQEFPYPDKTVSGKEIHHTFNDAHYHSPRHVWERSESAPKGSLVKGWPETSPPQ
jgi:hypothetical protein